MIKSPANGKKSKARASGKHDTDLGKKIRIRRVEQKISQMQLGDRLGVSFQQVQKYEKGVNRVSAARLMQIAKALEVEMGYFYETSAKGNLEVESILFDDPKYSLRLLRAYAKVSVEVQRHVVTLL